MTFFLLLDFLEMIKKNMVKEKQVIMNMNITDGMENMEGVMSSIASLVTRKDVKMGVVAQPKNGLTRILFDTKDLLFIQNYAFYGFRRGSGCLSYRKST